MLRKLSSFCFVSLLIASLGCRPEARKSDAGSADIADLKVADVKENGAIQLTAIDPSKPKFVIVLDSEWAKGITIKRPRALKVIDPPRPKARGVKFAAIQVGDSLVYPFEKDGGGPALEEHLIIDTRGNILSGDAPFESGSISIGMKIRERGKTLISFMRYP